MVVTREPEWDDHARGRALRLDEHEASFCGCGCGQPLVEARDPLKVYVVDEFRCVAGRALDKIRRERREKAEEQKVAGWDDGLLMSVRPHDPLIDAPLPTPKKPRGATP